MKKLFNLFLFLLLAGVMAAQTTLPLPPQEATFTGSARGYWFTAPTDFTITSLRVPTDASPGPQTIAVVKFLNSSPPAFPSTTVNYTTLAYFQQVPGPDPIATSIPVSQGDIIGVLGVRGGDVNSYGPEGPYNTTLLGHPITLTRIGTQNAIRNGWPNSPQFPIFEESFFRISRVEMTVSDDSGPSLPFGYNNADVGTTLDPGWADYDDNKDLFTLGSTGNNGNPYQDAHHFVYREMCCNGTIIAKVKDIQTSTGIPGWAGVEMRETLDADAKKAALTTRLGNWVYRSVRTTINGPEQEQQYFSPSANQWLKLVRQGDYFSGYVRNKPSHAWQFRFAAYIPMEDCILVGLTSESYSPYVESVATFKKVRINAPCLMDEPILYMVESESQSEERPQPDQGAKSGKIAPSDMPEGKMGSLFNSSLPSDLDVKLYPNPPRDILRVEWSQFSEEEAELQIMDLNGKLIHRLQLDELTPTKEINLESLNLTNGVYMLNIRTETQVITKRFVKN